MAKITFIVEVPDHAVRLVNQAHLRGLLTEVVGSEAGAPAHAVALSITDVEPDAEQESPELRAQRAAQPAHAKDEPKAAPVPEHLREKPAAKAEPAPKAAPKRTSSTRGASRAKQH